MHSIARENEQECVG